MEKWKDIVGYEGLYQVSSFGQVRSVDRYTKRNGRNNRPSDMLLKGKILRTTVKPNHRNVNKKIKGYLQCYLSKDGVVNTKNIHRLVATAFVLNKKNNPCVNHKDGNKQNNIYSNLEWCTYKQNTRHGIKMGIIKWNKGEKNSNCKISDKQIQEIRKKYKSGIYTALKLSTEFDISRGYIYQIVTLKRRST